MRFGTVSISATVTLLLLQSLSADACTNLVVTPGASADGSAMLAYNTDDSELFGFLFHYPAHHYEKGEHIPPRQIYAWETGEYLGEIPDVPHTRNVIGNCNDVGLCIGETTFGGIDILQNPHKDSSIDYGSLIWIELQRSATAREAIHTMTSLMEQYGYASMWASRSYECVYLLE